MATNALPVPPPLEIHDSNAADKWRKFLAAWENYALATELGGGATTSASGNVVNCDWRGWTRSLLDIS